MTEEERDALLRGLSRSEQEIHKALVARGGPMTAPMLREPVGRTDGLTFELRHLCELGLIRPVGRKAIDSRHPAMAYAAVQPADVEKARERFAVRGPRRQKRRRPGASSIGQLREMEQGDYEHWYRVRRRVLELTQVVVQAEKMSFWATAPEDEREIVLDELRDLRDATDEAIAAFKMRAEDDAIREKITKLRVTNGRTDHEVATAHRLADKLEEKL